LALAEQPVSSEAVPPESHRRLLNAIGELYDDAPHCADMAGLRYVEADDPGLSRRRRGRGFSYRDAHGRPVDVWDGSANCRVGNPTRLA
jgi:DNA topoisomerase-1